eukprot:CAMPEP_0113934978 /NCGR_PEP_ID=MMETSP1339-20121228/2224_1 /TAXON_ID=94617 /ORGANISM="Fibrocapsa japonica" /LENGTH=380 /DNA_ID=CAMNT_0000936987 /DNA_START=139 /DNA_END=1281 /DNA_ORIENTATION=- /assembly_acc=CAM_ASM_000762
MKACRGQKAPGALVFEKTYPNEKFDAFVDIVKLFLDESGVKDRRPAAACLAVAGPVKSNSVTLTNRGWSTIEGKKLERQLGIERVKLVNDFVGTGFGLLTLNSSNPKEIRVVQGGTPKLGGPIACIGAGTGLGEVYLAPNGPGTHDYEAFPTEGGHTDWAPKNEVEFGLMQFLKEKFGEPNRVSVERVVSGPGLATAYEYMAKAFPDQVNNEFHARFEAAGDLNAREVAVGAKEGDVLCKKVMELFAKEYGYEAANAALKYGPTGGLYLAGGIAPKNPELIADEGSPFLCAYADKGRMKGVVGDIPLFMVLNEEVGLRGAHLVAFKLWTEIRGSLAGASVRCADDKSNKKIPYLCSTGGALGLIALGGLIGIIASRALTK